GGKSTTLWGMLHHGWRYVSDELAPIDLATLYVHPYPRALGLKDQPPPAFPLPAQAVTTPRAIHVPVAQLPSVSTESTCRVEAAFFITYRGDGIRPSIRPVSAGEAGARLYANALNQLSHPNAGLNAAIQIAKGIASFALDTSDLAETCQVITAHTAR
ncbi:MAG: hypothetical protein KDB00_25600, partial [Planctomycetales bacterium]|nr:hypothetical protein [Planctomycetales bacterium]